MRILSLVWIILMVFTSVGFAEQAVESPQVAKIKAEVRKHGSGESSKVRVTLANGTVIKGHISGIDESSFDVNGNKMGQATSISYADVQKIQGPGLSTPAKVAIVVAVAVAAVAIVFAVAYKKSGLSR